MEYGRLTDLADEQEALARQDHEHQEWLRNEAAQAEYQSWIALLNSQDTIGHAHENA